MKTNYYKHLGGIIGLIAMGLAWYWFGVKLVLIIILAIWGNNLEVVGRALDKERKNGKTN